MFVFYHSKRCTVSGSMGLQTEVTINMLNVHETRVPKYCLDKYATCAWWKLQLTLLGEPSK